MSPPGLRGRLSPQRIGRPLGKMLRLMVKSDPRVLVVLEEGDFRRRKVRFDKCADCYAYYPGCDFPFPKQRRSALRAKVVGNSSLFRSWTDERSVGSVDLDLLLVVIRTYAENG